MSALRTNEPIGVAFSPSTPSSAFFVRRYWRRASAAARNRGSPSAT